MRDPARAGNNETARRPSEETGHEAAIREDER